MVVQPTKLRGDEMQPTRHIVFSCELIPELSLRFLTQPKRRNYVHGRITAEGILTLLFHLALRIRWPTCCIIV